MKAIIFDLDNTLIMWKDEFIFALKGVLNDMHYDFSSEKIAEIDNSINEEEKHFVMLKKDELLTFINEKCLIDLPIEFIDKLIIAQKELYYKDPELISTLEYLSQKYDLFIITNWFTETQVGRCANMGILKYFKEIYGADINYFKPHPKVFDVILDKYKPNECISVGDSLENDVILPLSLGMDAYLVGNNNDYKSIDNVYELRRIL